MTFHSSQLDKEIRCEGPWKNQPCPGKETFFFTSGEQQYYREHGYETPKRCPKCRQARKQLNELKQNPRFT